MFSCTIHFNVQNKLINKLISLRDTNDVDYDRVDNGSTTLMLKISSLTDLSISMAQIIIEYDSVGNSGR